MTNWTIFRVVGGKPSTFVLSRINPDWQLLTFTPCPPLLIKHHRCPLLEKWRFSNQPQKFNCQHMAWISRLPENACWSATYGNRTSSNEQGVSIPWSCLVRRDSHRCTSLTPSYGMPKPGALFHVQPPKIVLPPCEIWWSSGSLGIPIIYDLLLTISRIPIIGYYPHEPWTTHWYRHINRWSSLIIAGFYHPFFIAKN